MKAVGKLNVGALRAALLCGFAAASLVVGSGAQGATATGVFTVQTVIAAACNVTATPLNFGTYIPTAAAALTGSSTVSVYCTSGTAYTTSLNVGSGGGSFSTRTLASGGNTLGYNLYKDAAMTSVWGDGTGSTVTVTGTGSGLLTANTIPVYGQIPISQDKAPGIYASIITVTVSY